jgi:methyltransferase (TIGR00027 family)
MNHSTQDVFSISVDHVSDTAWLVAAYRMMESNREDGYFKDSLAPKLLGEKGKEILERFPNWKFGEWMMSVRTTLIDRTLSTLIQEGADAVINLAAGLDTRPYRMNLPKNLVWIEADYASLIQYKNQQLKEDVPNCQLERVSVDLANSKERMHFIQGFNRFKKAVVLTEGLLPYLTSDDVRALSHDLHSSSHLHAWVMDIATRDFFEWSQRHHAMEQGAAAPHVVFHFFPKEGIRFFEPLGWRVKNFLPFYEHGILLNRSLPSELVDQDIMEILMGAGIGILSK